MFSPEKEEYARKIYFRAAVYNDVNDERNRQDEKWGIQSLPNGTGYRIDQKIAEQARELTDYYASIGVLTWADILSEEFHEAIAEKDPIKLREELIQTIAVAVAWIEDLDGKS